MHTYSVSAALSGPVALLNERSSLYAFAAKSLSEIERVYTYLIVLLGLVPLVQIMGLSYETAYPDPVTIDSC